MPEEASAASSSGSVEEKPCSSSSSSSAAAADCSVDVAEEAKKLIGTGNRHLVMGDVVAAVGVFQDACGMLAAKYGDTAEECGEAFFLCGKSLLELARMENSVLGNALEGVPEESEEEEQPNSSNIESANNLDGQ
ncbi:Histone-binding protein N1/N2 [Liparis tanakae]|uniref:Histone-binding protein N1/N2 n=1 Tax=Liparis tanakae TaxID=230148 RepID=A0A4Z2F125_9TELE|nr:Histone-binding protein N1/N2 [Liparis tanakae]